MSNWRQIFAWEVGEVSHGYIFHDRLNISFEGDVTIHVKGTIESVSGNIRTGQMSADLTYSREDTSIIGKVFDQQVANLVKEALPEELKPAANLGGGRWTSEVALTTSTRSDNNY